MDNVFVTDTQAEYIDEIITDLSLCLKHPRVTKITVAPCGTITVDLSEPTKAPAATDIIRKQEGLHKANKTGFRGVSISGNKYRADYTAHGFQDYLGTFNTMQEAVEARIRAEMEAQ
jgi:hypothetical protein